MLSKQEKQEKFNAEVQSIKKAIGEDELGQCPRCKNLYVEKIGCAHVRCPNLRCNTWFCWHCGEKDATKLHFVGGRCNLEYNDILKMSYFIIMTLFMGPITAVFCSIPVFLFLYVFVPLIITFGLPYYAVESIRSKFEIDITQNKAAGFVLLLFYIELLPIGSLAASFSLPFATPFFCLYLALIFIKFIPIPVVGQVFTVLNLLGWLQWLTGLFGYGDWLAIIEQATEEKKMDEQRRAQEEAEDEPRMNKQSKKHIINFVASDPDCVM